MERYPQPILLPFQHPVLGYTLPSSPLLCDVHQTHSSVFLCLIDSGFRTVTCGRAIETPVCKEDWIHFLYSVLGCSFIYSCIFILTLCETVSLEEEDSHSKE